MAKTSSGRKRRLLKALGGQRMSQRQRSKPSKGGVSAGQFNTSVSSSSSPKGKGGRGK